MKYLIHYSDINHNTNDSVVIEGADVGEIYAKARTFLAERGLTADSADAWSEPINEELHH
jgi:hypothetical protein